MTSILHTLTICKICLPVMYMFNGRIFCFSDSWGYGGRYRELCNDIRRAYPDSKVTGRVGRNGEIVRQHISLCIIMSNGKVATFTVVACKAIISSLKQAPFGMLQSLELQTNDQLLLSTANYEIIVYSNHIACLFFWPSYHLVIVSFCRKLRGNSQWYTNIQ